MDTYKKAVRLTEEEIRAIKDTVREVFGENSSVWLFGSRTDIKLKGGDIDLYVETNKSQVSLSKKIDFLVKLKDIIGDQKIDVILKPHGCNEPMCIDIKSKGVKL
ncbi:MAG: nucleotidyltransferase domain-containing protein [Aquificae bacterium]|nr:nucleotidyltransferase domain-containing protein [Aquificota bacterium]